MTNYVIKKGCFLNKEDNSQVTSLSGNIVAIIPSTTENNVPMVSVDLHDGEDVKRLTIRRYGDASLKIFRSLFSALSTISSSVIKFTIEDRGEGTRSRIEVSADGDILAPAGTTPQYFYDKMTITDHMVRALAAAVLTKLPVLVVNDGSIADNSTSPENASVIRSVIIDNGGIGNCTNIHKRTFTSAALRKAYVNGVLDASPSAKIFTEPSFIELVTCPQASREDSSDETSSGESGSTNIDDDDDEV